MRKNLRWKMLTILAVAAAAAFAVYPPEDQVRLGLDLRGGVHLVLQVQTRRRPCGSRPRPTPSS